ncbi:TPA: carboxymuconolactone decarboxylase family protein, partial [Streptococcus suis]|nr:carboxymuconolactone decarboxylase family protein [Streptococcus suis]
MELPMTQAFFLIHTLETVSPELRENLATVKKNNGGYIPNLIGLLANSPTALETYQTVSGINRRSSLNPTEREVVQITAAVANGCGFCVAGHT